MNISQVIKDSANLKKAMISSCIDDIENAVKIMINASSNNKKMNSTILLLCRSIHYDQIFQKIGQQIIIIDIVIFVLPANIMESKAIKSN